MLLSIQRNVMKLNFAKSELLFTHDTMTCAIKDNVSGKEEYVVYKHLNEVSFIMDIQEKLMFCFNVWSLDVDNFNKIKDYVRQLKMKEI